MDHAEDTSVFDACGEDGFYNYHSQSVVPTN